jgi:dTDP-4-amino-4,6-dideoxygalactose transaminase
VAPISRDRLIDVLWAENVRARRYFYPGCHRMEPYRSRGVAAGLTATEQVSSRILILPTGQAMSDDDVLTVAALVRLAVVQGRELTDAIDATAREHADVDAR